MTARSIAIIQQKGGVGKSTTVVELACAWGVHGARPRNVAPIDRALPKSHFKVLVVDLDAQAGATRKLGINPDDIAREQSIIAVLEDESHPITASLWQGVYPGFGIDVVPGHFDLEATEAELARRPDAVLALREKLATVRDQYDFILIDSRPSLGMLTLNALFAADEVILPVKMTDTECKNGVRQALIALDELAEAGGETELLGALATFYDARKQRVADDIRQYVTTNLGIPFLNAVIPDRSHFGNAALEGLPVGVWRPNLDAASRYRWLAAEIIERAPLPAHV
jgi:chromosome partitioning protein